jgi:hypothetical protein
VPRGAAACDDCGACAKSGWKDNAEVYDGLDLPDDQEEFNYDDFVAREFGGKPQAKKLTRNPWWWVALVLVIVIIIGYVMNGG